MGRKAQNYFKFRNWDITESWTGFSEQPQYENAAEIAVDLGRGFHEGRRRRRDQQSDDDQGVDELHIVYSEFKSMMSQAAMAHRIAPLVVEYVEDTEELHTLYSFEPDATTLFESLLPRYVTTRVYAALLESAASELASRQRAMKSATDNADDLIKELDADGEPRAAGPDHPGDQRNRRRRKRARRRQVAHEEAKKLWLLLPKQTEKTEKSPRARHQRPRGTGHRARRRRRVPARFRAGAVQRAARRGHVRGARRRP